MKKRLSEFVLGCKLELISEKVVLAPCWEPASVGIDRYIQISDNTCRIWKCEYEDVSFTYIVTGVGACLCADIVMALKATQCKELLFIGSAGALDSSLNVGDFVIPKKLVCGEGASRYHQKNCEKDLFGIEISVDENLNEKLFKSCLEVSKELGIKCVNGRGISVESVFSEYRFIDKFRSMGCNCIDMEASSVIFAANTNGIKGLVTFCISDNSVKGESLMDVKEEKTLFRKKIRKLVIPKVLAAFLL